MIITERCPPPDWDDCASEENSPTSTVALDERIAYLMTAASEPGSVRTPAEQTRLRHLARELGIPESETQRVLAALCETDSR